MLLKKVASGLGLPEKVIKALSRKASYSYKTYTIPKRSGGSREIHHPSKELKALQRWLVLNVISQWPVHGAAMAYRLGVSILSNAQRHAQNRFLLRMDFSCFFPSITSDDIKRFLDSSDIAQQNRWNCEDIELFTALVCRNGILTIGAPSSPSLSNALCFELDHKLESLAHGRKVTYSRYADDLFFSTNEPNVLKDFPDFVARIVAETSCPAGLKINELKTRHSSKKGRRQVTGLMLRSDNTVGVGRGRKRLIRALIHKYDLLSPDQKRSLAGLLSFARSIEPDFINALILKFGIERVIEAQKPEI